MRANENVKSINAWHIKDQWLLIDIEKKTFLKILVP